MRLHDPRPAQQETTNRLIRPELQAGRSVADALIASWKLEAGSLEEVGDAFDHHLDGTGSVEVLEGKLAALAELAERATFALRAARGN